MFVIHLCVCLYHMYWRHSCSETLLDSLLCMCLSVRSSCVGLMPSCWPWASSKAVSDGEFLLPVCYLPPGFACLGLGITCPAPILFFLSFFQLIRLQEKNNKCFRIITAHFLRRVASRFRRAARVAFPAPDVGVTRTEADWAILLSEYYSFEVLRRLKVSRQVWATHTIRCLVDRITSVQQGDNNKQTQYPRAHHKGTGGGGNASRNWAGIYCTITTRPLLFFFELLK